MSRGDDLNPRQVKFESEASKFKMRKKDDKATIKIPRNLYNNLKALLEDSGFDSVTDFVVYVLRDIASSPQFRTSNDRVWDRRELKLVKEKLKKLGYLD